MSFDISRRYQNLKNKWETDDEFRRRMTASYVAVAFGGILAYKVLTKPQKSLYSYGVESIWKVRATDAEVGAFNRVMGLFYEVQKRMADAGTPWDGQSTLKQFAERKDIKMYNTIGKRLNKSLRKIDQQKNRVEIFGDYLVKN